jgi:hypothetical protein
MLLIMLTLSAEFPRNRQQATGNRQQATGNFGVEFGFVKYPRGTLNVLPGCTNQVSRHKNTVPITIYTVIVPHSGVCCLSPESGCLNPGANCLNFGARCLNPELYCLNPELYCLNPEMRCLNPETDCLNPETDCLNLETDCLNPETDCLNPETDCLNPDTCCLNPDAPGTASGVPVTVNTGESVAAPYLYSILLRRNGCSETGG